MGRSASCAVCCHKLLSSHTFQLVCHLLPVPISNVLQGFFGFHFPDPFFCGHLRSHREKWVCILCVISSSRGRVRMCAYRPVSWHGLAQGQDRPDYAHSPTTSVTVIISEKTYTTNSCTCRASLWRRMSAAFAFQASEYTLFITMLDTGGVHRVPHQPPTIRLPSLSKSESNESSPCRRRP